MPGKRIPALTAIAGASTANDDNLVIYDTSEGTTKRILRSQLAAGLVGDLPYTPSGGIAATTVPTAIAELDSEAAKSAALAASSGSSLVGFLQSGTSAVARTTQAKMRDVVSVFDFMTSAEQQDVANGTGALDVTAAIDAALTYAKAISFSEKELVFPAGLYRVTQFDFTGVELCTFRAQGTVQIYGNGAADFVFGCDGYVASGNPDADSTFTRSANFIGGNWLIANSGGTYTHIFKCTAAVGCTFENFGISGTCGATSGANRIAAALNFCWVNRFVKFSAGSPGVPGAGFRSFNIAVGPLGGANVNNNLFESCRIQAGNIGAPFSNQVGISLQGANANAIKTCDISALDVGIELINTRGTVCDSNYHEAVKTIVDMPSGNSRGNTFIGGIYEVQTDGAAFKLTSSQNTTIVNGQYFGVSGGSNRTFIAQGSACYGLSVVSPELQDIDNTLTGTYQGASTVSGARILQAQWLSFPPTQVTSSNANTLDDYEEGTWTPTKTIGTAYTSATGRYTKVGNLVTVTFIVQFAIETSASSSAMSGFPFSAGGSTSESNGLAVGYQSSAIQVGGSLATTTMTFRQIGTGVASAATITQMSGALVTGTMTYTIN